MTENWRVRRIAQNEASFREINERLEDGLRRVQHTEEVQQFVCECGSRECEQLVSLSFDEYEEIRRDSRHFAVVPGHVFPATERVIAGNERFDIDEKQGPGIEGTDATDQRSPGDIGLREG